MKAQKVGFKCDCSLIAGEVDKLKHALFLPLIDWGFMEGLNKIVSKGVDFGCIAVDAGGKIAVDKKFRKQLSNFPLAI